jgi:hypothetical protein
MIAVIYNINIFLPLYFGYASLRNHQCIVDCVKGHPYLIQDWTAGTLKTIDGKQYENVELKYDLNRDELSIRKRGTSQVIALFNEKVESFSLQERQFIMIGSEDGNRFYEKLVDGDKLLLVHRKKKLLKADYEGAYSGGRTQDEFLTPSSEYYALQDQKLVKLKMNAKSLAQAYGVSDKEVKQKIRALKLLLKEEGHLIELISSL